MSSIHTSTIEHGRCFTFELVNDLLKLVTHNPRYICSYFLKSPISASSLMLNSVMTAE